MTGRLGLVGGALVLAGAILVGAGAVVGGGWGPSGWGPGPGGMMGGGPGGMMGGAGMMGGPGGGPAPGMMGGPGGGPGPGMRDGGRGSWSGAPGPGEAGFVAGTPTAPRLVRVLAGPGYSFGPSAVRVARGETVLFEVTSMGGLVHEFMVGPAAAVAADEEGTPEIADIGMMQTKSITYTFDGSGPYAFACHAPGHYEAGMRGTIEVVG